MSHCIECGLKLWSIEKDICLCCKKKHSPEVELCKCPTKVEVNESLEAVEKRHILKVLKRNDYSKVQTARDLQIALKTLYNKLIQYGHLTKEY